MPEYSTPSIKIFRVNVLSDDVYMLLVAFFSFSNTTLKLMLDLFYSVHRQFLLSENCTDTTGLIESEAHLQKGT